ncbi:MAG: CPBP family intramembrane metalloprotease [Gemmatimonadetes bacterium]|nr:CPBP family intramembrane metalloprotease [Gemmatimonadota bacterium]
MQQTPEAWSVFTSPCGRMRLGWRLLLFALLTFTIAAASTLVLPASQVAGSAALLVGALVAGLLLLVLEGRPAGALGFHVGREAVSASLLGLALGAAVALLVVTMIAAAGGLVWSPQPGTWGAWLVGGAGALLFFALPAAAEEVFLRGYPIQALAEEWGAWPAILVTAGAFGALHLGNPGVTAIGMLNVAVAGVFLGVVYLKTLSLWWASGAHLGWNWVHGYLADVPVSGLELMDAPLYDGVVRGPAWLGGGAFGPEGSLVATAVVAAAAIVCWRARWLRPSEAALATRPLASPLSIQLGTHA